MLVDMDVSLAVIADAANVTRDGKLNILGVFNTIYSSAFPTVHSQMQLIVRFLASPAERGTQHKTAIKLLDMDGSELIGLAGTVAVPQRSGIEEIGVYSIIDLRNVAFARAGDYSFRILIDDNEKATVPLKLVLRGQPELPS